MTRRVRTVLVTTGILLASGAAALAVRVLSAEEEALRQTLRVEVLRELDQGRELVRLLPVEPEGALVPVEGVTRYPGGLAVIRRGGDGNPLAPVKQPVAVRTVTLEPSDVQRRLLAFGTVEAEHDARVPAEVSGVVKRLRVRLGQAVAAGDPLVELDSRDAELAASRAESELARAKATHARLVTELASLRDQLVHAKETLDTRTGERERWEGMAEQGLATPDRADQARVLWRAAHGEHTRVQGSLRSTRAALAEAKAALGLVEVQRRTALLFRERCTVRAPFAGRVAERLVQIGEHLPAGAPVVRLVAQARVRVRVHVREGDAAAVVSGARVRLSVPGTAGQATTVDATGGWSGRVEGVAAASDPASRKVAVDVVVANPEPSKGALPLLRAGMFARVSIDGGRVTNTYLIPDDAVVTSEEGVFVYALEGDRVRKVAVVLGARQGEARLHRSGLKGKVELATSGVALLFDGAPVRRLSE